MILAIILSFLFLCFNWLDFYLTKRVLDKGGRELNPIVKVFGLLPVKIGASIVFPLAGFIIHPFVLIVPVFIGMFVCVWNFLQLRRI